MPDAPDHIYAFDTTAPEDSATALRPMCELDALREFTFALQPLPENTTPTCKWCNGFCVGVTLMHEAWVRETKP